MSDAVIIGTRVYRAVFWSCQVDCLVREENPACFFAVIPRVCEVSCLEATSAVSRP
jgi:hypothetical protein